MLHYTLVGTDNQASLLALNNQKPHPAHYLIDHIHDTAEKLHAKQSYLCAPTITQAPTCKVIDLHLHWTPGHMDFSPNERADDLAKSAAQGSSSPQPPAQVPTIQAPTIQHLSSPSREHDLHPKGLEEALESLSLFSTH